MATKNTTPKKAPTKQQTNSASNQALQYAAETGARITPAKPYVAPTPHKPPLRVVPTPTAPVPTTPTKTTPTKTTPTKTTPTKTTPTKTQLSGASGASGSSSGSAGLPYGVAPEFQEYYNAILASLAPQAIGYDAVEFQPITASMTPQLIDYTAPTTEEIAAEISAYLRPGVDQQIRDRQNATLRQRAMTDADAASRGMLSSTWVTDSKNRIAQQENADIADVEAAYRAQLLQGVSEREQANAERAHQVAVFNAQMQQAADEFNAQVQQTNAQLGLQTQQNNADRKQQIDMFNAQLQQAAEENAYKRAGDMYQLYLAGKPVGGGSGSGSGSGNGFYADGKFWPDAQAYYDYVAEQLGKLGISENQGRVQSAMAQAIQANPFTSSPGTTGPSLIYYNR